MKNVIAFAGSNSKTSINKKLVSLAVSKLSNANASVLDLNDFEVPVYGIDFEVENGIPESAKKLSELIENSDAIILSLAEHNGSYAAVFKSIFDWMSRINPKVWRNKPMLLMSASPGGRGGAGVLGSAKMAFPHLGGNIVAEFSLPSFFDHFQEGQLTSKALESELSSAVLNLEEAL